MAQVIVDKEKCVGCGLCVDVCDPGVLDIEGDFAFPFNIEDCTECFLCQENCPEAAVEVKRG